MARRTQKPVHHELEGTAQLVQSVPQPPKEEKAISLRFKIEFVGGGEDVELEGLNEQLGNTIINWYKGNTHPVIDIPVGKELILIDRANVTHLVVSQED